MTDWRTKTVEECLLKVQLESNFKLQTQEYRPAGRFPIVDQGQSLIAGWTDDERGLVAEGLPYVVFGDHTRAFKFIDFPFVRGADGTQILKPKTDIDPLFFFYALRAVDLPSRGYNRHFSVLKEKEIRIAQDGEQSEIALSLKLVEDAAALQLRQIEAWQDLKRAAMRALFTKGLRGEAQKDTEIGPVPESWEIRPLEEVAEIYSSSRLGYGELLAREEQPAGEPSHSVLGIKVIDMTRCEPEVLLSDAELKKLVSQPEAERRCIAPGAIVFPKNGAAVATNKKRRVATWCVLDPNVMALHAKDGMIQEFLYQWMLNFDLRSIVKPGPVPNFGKGDISGVPVQFPGSIEEQREIVVILDAIDQKIDLHKRKRAVLDELFKSLLHKLMTGEIRVADLDLSALEMAEPEGAAA